MDKEMLDIVNDLSKKPTTELALQIMELSSENLILEQQVKKQKEAIDKVIKIFNECKSLMPHEFDWEEQVYNVIGILKEVLE